MDLVLSASLLAANHAKLAEEAIQAMVAGVKRIHIDVMDNHYVPNLSFGSKLCVDLRSANINIPLEVHLMVNPVDKVVEDFLQAGADTIIVHPSTCNNLQALAKLVKHSNGRLGLALNPGVYLQDIDDIYATMPYCDMLVLMGVTPGFTGQPMLPLAKITDKIMITKNWLQQHNFNLEIMLDGGVNQHNILALHKSGADSFVVGKYLFSSLDYSGVVRELNNCVAIK